MLQECSAYGRRPTVTQYTGYRRQRMAQGEGGILSEATNTEYTWTILHMTLAHLLTTGIEVQEEQPVPSWGGFNIIF